MIALSLLCGLWCSASPAAVPIRFAAVTGQPVPDEDNRAIISRLENPTIGHAGEVIFFLESDNNREFPAQHVIDLRGVTSIPESERIVGPLMGAIRDAPLGDGTAASIDAHRMVFSPSGELLIPAQGTLSADDPEETRLLVVRRTDGTLELLAHEGTARTPRSHPYAIDPDSVQLNIHGDLLGQHDDGLYRYSEDVKKVVGWDDPVPDEEGRTFDFQNWRLLDDGRVWFCCGVGLPYIWNEETLRQTAPTPLISGLSDGFFLGPVHHTGTAAFTDWYRNEDTNLDPAVYVGTVDDAPFISAASRDDLCPDSSETINLRDIIATDAGGRATVASPCGFLQLSPGSGIEWLVQRGDRAADRETTFTGFGASAALSDDGNSILFRATADHPTHGAIDGLWLIPFFGQPAEDVTHIGALVDVAEGDARRIEDILFGEGAINDLGQAVVLVIFSDAESGVRSPSGVLIANQPPLPSEAEADLSLEDIHIDPSTRTEQPSLDVAIDIFNDGPDAVGDISLDVDVGDALALTDADWPGCEQSGERVRCTISTGDPDGLIPSGASFTVTLTLNRLELMAPHPVTATVSASTTDPDTSNNTLSASFQNEGIAVTVIETRAPRINLELRLINEDDQSLQYYVCNAGFTDEEKTILPQDVTQVGGELSCSPNATPDFPALLFCQRDEAGLTSGDRVTPMVVEIDADYPQIRYRFDCTAQRSDGTYRYATAQGTVDLDDPSTINTGPSKGCATAPFAPLHASMLMMIIAAVQRRRASWHGGVLTRSPLWRRRPQLPGGRIRLFW
ncbi:MAG: hypothetical protein AAFV53_25225 [Myxococcota bacterium]